MSNPETLISDPLDAPATDVTQDRPPLRLATTGSSADEQPSRPVARRLPIPDEPLLDIRAVAVWLSVSESVVRKWTAAGPASGLVPVFIRVNGQVRFRPADVRTFLIEREVR